MKLRIATPDDIDIIQALRIEMLKEVAGKTKLVPETSDMLTVARRMGISLG